MVPRGLGRGTGRLSRETIKVVIGFPAGGPLDQMPEFVRYAKSRPGQINYGSAGNGGISHLVPEMFKTATGLYMVHIPYRGSAPASPT